MNCYCSECNAEKDHAEQEPSPEMLPRSREAREYIEVRAKSIEGFEWSIQLDMQQLGTQDPFGEAKELAETYFQTVYPYCKDDYILSMLRKISLP